MEEGFITFPTVPGGFIAKVGKMRDVFGKVDGQHNHVLPFTDRPLVTKNLTGGEDGLSDYGITLSRLIPNSLALPRGHRTALPRPLGGLRRHHPRRPDLRGPSARVSRPQRVHEPRPRRLHRLRLQQRRVRTFTPASSASTPPTAAVRCAGPSTTGSSLAPSSSGAGARSPGPPATPSASTSPASTSSPGAGSPAPATTIRTAPATPRSTTRAARCS